MSNQAQVTRFGLCDLQVCVPKSFTDQQAEEFANAEHPTGIASQWRMKKTGDETLGGDPERVQCAQLDDHVHIMLSC
jgi:hypothetical protein